MAELPAEVWLIIFGYLSVPDKHSVRASCKYFKRLADQASLWRNWTIVLRFQNGLYHSNFWASLRRRRVSSAVVRNAKVKHWMQLSLSLPRLSTVVLEQNTAVNLRCLGDFTQLRRVAVRSRGSPVPFHAHTVSEHQQLTHLSLCGVTFPFVSSFLAAVCKLAKLTSLTCHVHRAIEKTPDLICYILSQLPELKHLSVTVRQTFYNNLDDFNPNFGQHAESGNSAGLSSLELIDCCDISLPECMMRWVPGLSSLALFYKSSHHEWFEGWPRRRCRLQTWLQDLPHLTKLVIVRGPPVGLYTSWIPTTVTSLTLCVAGVTPEDLAAVALRIPNLLHLHVDPWPSHLGAHTADIARLFPKLRSLKLRHERVLEDDFLLLHQLQDLTHLEILDDCPRLSELIRKFQAVTRYRVNVTVFPHKRDVLSCPCVEQVY